jgi:TonB family protein
MRAGLSIAAAVLAAVLSAYPASAQDSAPPAADSPGITPPVPVTDHYDTMGKYPLESILHEDRGDVRLTYTIEKDGTVDHVEVTQTSHHPRLDQASIKEAESWRFHPATKDGEPIAVTDTFEMHWRLTQEQEPIPEPLQFFMKQADFPAGAWDRHEEGVVQVLLSLDKNGNVAGYFPETTSGYDDLDAAAKTFLTKTAHFAPPAIEGKPVAGQIEALVVWSMTPHKDVPFGAEWGVPR